MLLTSKYLPENLNSSKIHINICKIFNKIINNHNIPNLIIYGKSLCGKSILIDLILKKIYKKIKNNIEKINIKISNTSNKYEITFIKNTNYIIYSLTHNISYDRYIIKELTKIFTETKNVNLYLDSIKYKIIIIKNAEYLSQSSQAFLRRTMEKHSEYCKFILHTHDLTSIITPLQSRSLCIRIPSISHEECLSYIQYVTKKENINIEVNEIKKLLNHTNNNLYDSLLIIQKYKNNIDYTKIKMSYQYNLEIIVNNFFNELKIENLLNNREIIYKLFVNNLSKTNIIEYILIYLLKKLDDYDLSDENKFKLKKKIINDICECENSIVSGNKLIFYFEYLFFKMNCYLSKLNSNSLNFDTLNDVIYDYKDNINIPTLNDSIK